LVKLVEEGFFVPLPAAGKRRAVARLVQRRHVDLLRVNSAICRVPSPA
jgi:hypothetical protein